MPDYRLNWKTGTSDILAGQWPLRTHSAKRPSGAHLTYWRLLYLWKVAKELRKEGRKETKIPFKFQLYFKVLMSILWQVFSWTSRNMSRFLFSVVVSSKLVVMSSGCFFFNKGGCYKRRKLPPNKVWDLRKHVCYLLAAEIKRVLLVSRVKLKYVWVSLWCQ